MPSDTLKSIASVVQGVAPVIASVLGGPAAGALTSLGLGTLAKFLGIQEDNPTPEKVLSSVTTAMADPATKLQIIQAENDFALKMKGLEIQQQGQQIDLIKTGLADVQSARQETTAQTKATGKRDINLYALAWVIMGGFIGLIVCMLVLQYSYGKILQNDPLLTLLLGSLSTDAGMVVGYFFGSSLGSKSKDELLLAAGPTKP